MRAIRGLNLLLQVPVPGPLKARLRVLIQEPETRLAVDDDGQAVFGVTGEPIELTNYVTREVFCGVDLPNEFLLVPRHSFSDEELEEYGYVVEDTREEAPTCRALVGAGATIEMREYNGQDKAFDALMEAGHGFVVLGTGKGKTVLALKAVGTWCEPTLLLLHNGTLLEQWKEEVERFLGIEQWAIGRCQGPYATWKWKGAAFTVAMLPSFYNQLRKGRIPPEFFEYFGTVIWDEAHHAIAPTFSSSLGLFHGRRVALSATPDRDGWEKLLYYHVGKPVYWDVEADLRASCYFTPTQLSSPREFESRNRASYGGMASHVLGNDNSAPDLTYLSTIVRCLRHLTNRGRKTLIIVPRKRFCEALEEELEGLVVVDGSVPFNLRSKLVREHDLIAVTPKVGSEGLNRVDLDALVLTYPLGKKAEDAMRQTVGRILRAMKEREKPQPELHAFFPDNRYGLALARANEQLCRDLGYEIERRAVRHQPPRARSLDRSGRRVRRVSAPEDR